MTLIVEIDDVLRKVGGRQLAEVTPHVADAYGQYLSSLAGLTMLAVADAYDDAAQIRLDENNAIRALLEAALPNLEAGALRAQLTPLCQVGEQSVRISDLNASNMELRHALIGLHAHVEANLQQPWAAALNEAILAEYVASAGRQRFDGLDNFV